MISLRVHAVIVLSKYNNITELVESQRMEALYVCQQRLFATQDFVAIFIWALPSFFINFTAENFHFSNQSLKTCKIKFCNHVINKSININLNIFRGFWQKLDLTILILSNQRLMIILLLLFLNKIYNFSYVGLSGMIRIVHVVL